MTKKIFHSIFTVAIAVLIVSFGVVIGMTYNYFSAVQKQQVREELSLLVSAVEMNGEEYLQQINDSEDHRVTWIDKEGHVIFDSVSQISYMDNHLDRTEVKQALESGFGESDRYSQTLNLHAIYYAIKLDDGSILRMSLSKANILTLYFKMLLPITLIIMLIIFLSVFISKYVSKKIVQPLNALDLEKPLENDVYPEIQPLLLHIDNQHTRIKDTLTQLNSRKLEFYSVIKNLQEGLIVLNNQFEVLSINNAAMEFFDTNPNCIGKKFCTFEDNAEILKALDVALEKGKSTTDIERFNIEYKVNISRIAGETEGQYVGVVVLVFDNSEVAYAERTRREFTANVSHELKTPLHAIMGSAELIENGIVKENDVQNFAHKISKESGRLIALIEDIIRLSQLDEKAEIEKGEIDLYQLVKKEVEDVQSFADISNIELKVTGRSAVVKGEKQLLHEIVNNLLTNAIKYNKPNGIVKITTSIKNDKPTLCVEDTGIGIAPQHLDRIFERFYRVDKSHSKETGGTGLGLAIVKHAVQYLGGKIDIQSAVDKGTKITVQF